MATFQSIFVPDSTTDQSATLGATTSTAEIVLGANTKIAIIASGAFNIRFGNAGMGAASATNFQIPSSAIAEYDLGDHQDRLRIFNPGASTITYWITKLYDA
jgi:hypothetical protein